MEHRLIQGGETFLPFARSRIKALLALGLPYADQSFEVDGVSIKVRIQPGHEYIRIEGGACSLKMDSGVVDVFALGELSPLTYLPGVLHESGSAKNYNALFQYHTDNPPGRTNKASASGQMSGVITKKQEFEGRILDGAPSFYTKGENDGELRLKKITSVLCPASIFTGRCRLYVQAVYGLPLYEYGKDGSIKSTNAPPEIVSATSAAPALWLNGYKADEAGDIRRMLLDTSCGVWLDVVTGKHWLFKPANGTVTVYPLVSSACGEKLRKHLRDQDSVLNATDKNHLEAYILAYCLPDIKNRQTASGAIPLASFSMGYGWHWNWDGDTSDIVVTRMFEQDATNSAMESTHHRLRITKNVVSDPEKGDPAQTWGVNSEVMEGPSTWSVYRAYWTLAEPNYAEMILEKTTPQHSLIFECDAPVYAYYIGNTLNVLRVSVVYEPNGTPKRTKSEGFADSDTYQANDVSYSTLGTRDGFLEERSNAGWSYNAVFSCGDFSTPELKGGRTNTGSRIDLKDHVLTGWNFTASSYEFAWGQNFPSGYPPYTSNVRDNNTRSEYSSLSHYTLNTTSFSEEDVGTAQLVVPFYDSEAVYIRYATQTTRTDVGLSQSMDAANVGGFNYGTKYIVNVYDGGAFFHTEEFIAYGWNEGGTPSGAAVSASTLINDTTVSGDQKSVMLGHAGELPATFTHLGEFASNGSDFIGAEFATISSASDASPIIIAPGYVDPVNTHDTNFSVPVIVGWV